MAGEKEGLRKVEDGRVICSAPDVCKTPPHMEPVPYQIVGYTSDLINPEETVRLTGHVSFTMKTKVSSVIGDEPGTGGGMISQVNKSVCEPVTHSTTVRAKGQYVVRHTDKFMMNNGNTVGNADYNKGSGSGSSSINQDGTIAGDTNPPIDPTPQEKGIFDQATGWLGDQWNDFSKEFMKHGGEKIDDYKAMGGTIWDAFGGDGWDASKAAWGRIGTGAKAIGGLAADGIIVNTPILQDTSIGEASRNRLEAVGSKIVTGIVDGYGNAYKEGGVSGAFGHGMIDFIDLFAQAAVGEGVGAVGGAALKGAEAVTGVVKGATEVSEAALTGVKAAEATEKGLASAVAKEEAALGKAAEATTAEATEAAAAENAVDGVRVTGEEMPAPNSGVPQTSLPQKPGQIQHIFRDAPGHLPDTPANRALLEGLANDSSAVLGPDKFGNTWAGRLNPDGTQTWVQSRNGTIINGGVNRTPRLYNPQTGLSGP